MGGGGGGLASNDRPTPIVLRTNEQVKGGWLATPSTPTGSAPELSLELKINIYQVTLSVVLCIQLCCFSMVSVILVNY